jgi:hypothetical protein
MCLPTALAFECSLAYMNKELPSLTVRSGT